MISTQPVECPTKTVSHSCSELRRNRNAKVIQEALLHNLTNPQQPLTLQKRYSKNQIPANDPGYKLAHSGISVGVGAS